MTASSPIPSSFRGPGLIDLQVNGYAGFDFNGAAETWTPERLHAVRGAFRRRGVVAVLPTLISDEPERMIARARRYAGLVDADPVLTDAYPWLHIEGPFISPEEGPRGAHPSACCRTPSELPDFLERLQQASGGRVRLLTLAPELPGALELIEAAVADDVVVALGHTQASADEIQAAVEAGASLSTHLGNGSHQVLPRLDNYVQVQLAEDRLAASFIADGHHMPWYTLKNFIRAKTPRRCILITDAIAAADVGPGRYPLGGDEVVVSEDLRARKPGETNLAGSALTLDRAVLNVATSCGVPFRTAWEMASVTPAELLGMEVPSEISVRVTKEAFVAHDGTSAA